MNLTETDLVVCALSGCVEAMHPLDALWDEETDEPYCSGEHMAQSQWEEL